MGRIGQAAVSESVAEQQIAEFIVDSGNLHRQLRQKSKTDTDDDEEKGDERQCLALDQARKKGFDGVEHFRGQARQKYGKKGEVKGDAQDHAKRCRNAHQQNVDEVTHRGSEFSALDCDTRRKKYKGGCCAELPGMNGTAGLALGFHLRGAAWVVRKGVSLRRPGWVLPVG